MADFSTAHAPVAVWEGGYGNHPADRGGETLCGIARGCHPDLALWKLVDAEKDHPSFRQGSAAFTRHLRQIPGLLEQVTAFYRGLFHSLGLDSEDMPQELANEIYEQVVNLGQGGHTRYLQRICNAFNYNRKTGTRLFHDLKEDGALGTLTRAALSPKLPEEHADRIVSNTSTEKTAANHGQTFPQPCRPPEQRGEQFSPGHIISPYCRERRSWPSRSSRRILRSRRR